GRLVPRLPSLERLRARGLPVVEPLFTGVLGRRPLSSFCRRSAWGAQLGEGVVVERVGTEGIRWAKWVRRGYRQPAPGGLSGRHNRVLP
ncbi:MAG: hypothetical protein IT382_24085, partial [Deltaproteobacteria bacterium]|nr:hypothetical protein [Deltaproteobacteria bacterium]